ncbi:MAG: TonB-dependent receptor [Rhodospirillales bacterium]|nr:TonB-dependent receptor [Rhodospirillales bacterium]
MSKRFATSIEHPVFRQSVHRLLLVAGCGFAVISPPALADPVVANGETLEEITVVAQRREEKLHDVPIAISAFSAQSLEQRNITSVSGISGLVPNVQIVEAARTTSTQIAIRGGITVNPAAYWEPTVGIYIDGVYVGKNQGNVFDLPDLDHIEVLRGPQGTLYGRNTLSGAINIVTKKPSGEFGGFADFGVGDYGYLTGRLSVDLPKFGRLSVKISAEAGARDGFVDVLGNPNPAVVKAQPRTVGSLDNLNTRSARIAARLDATDSLTFDYVFEFDDARQLPQYQQLYRVAQGGLFDPTSPRYVGGGPVGGQYFGFPLNLYLQPSRSLTSFDNGAVNNGTLYETSLIRSHALTATWELDDIVLKSITAYRQMNWQNSADLDGTPLNVASVQLTTLYHSFSQELQATGKLDRFQYTAGAYYFSDGGPTDNPQQYFGGSTNIDPKYAFTTNSYALYGQVEYNPPILRDRLTLTAGLRYSNENKTGQRSETAVGRPGYIIPPDTSGSKNFDAATPLFIVKYNFSDDFNIYAKFSEGYKSGGFNLEAPTVAESVRPFDAETVDEYEVGSKLRFFDHRLEVNAAAFWDQRRNMQLSVFVPVQGGAVQSVVRNAGSADIRGLELEVAILPVDWLRLQGTLGYLAPTYNVFINNGVNVASDRAFPYSPPITASISADVTVAETEYGKLDLIMDYSHSDPYYLYPYSLSVDPNTGQNARTTKTDVRDLVDIRLRLADIPMPNGTADLSVWTKNLFDDKYRTQMIDFGPSFGGIVNAVYGHPRTIGANLTYHW